MMGCCVSWLREVYHHGFGMNWIVRLFVLIHQCRWDGMGKNKGECLPSKMHYSLGVRSASRELAQAVDEEENAKEKFRVLLE